MSLYKMAKLNVSMSVTFEFLVRQTSELIGGFLVLFKDIVLGGIPAESFIRGDILAINYTLPTFPNGMIC